MKIKIKVEKEVEIKTLKVKAKVRYWEDSCIDGFADTEKNMPCKVGNFWCPEIDIDTGCIKNWDIGKTASIHYKVCDNCSWKILDVNGNCIQDVEDQYVPDSLCPTESGWGDYIIMNIDTNGKIANFSFSIGDFM